MVDLFPAGKLKQLLRGSRRTAATNQEKGTEVNDIVPAFVDW